MNPTSSSGGAKGSRLPYWGVLCCALFVTASEVCLKKGADSTQNLSNALSWLETQALVSGWIWTGILFYIVSFVFWLRVLQILPLNIAFNLVNIEHIFVPLASYLFLGEVISPMRAAGIGIVLLGVWVIAESYCRVEERA
ncbi:EamA-like transporter family protein [Nitrosovibrio tenuis]|uniref:EamA-like transporter family protein n=1 Tax=Nitrosovibrio tenuis TaxID=1233 RepID=A0A1H7LUZ2_9PROT|nr:EamA-like transporter family protein [Nitrosovibrio tenuis]